jgi:hypothetical protein
MATKKKTKTSHYRAKPNQLSVVAPEKERLVISCSKEEKRIIRVLAALENMTISDYLLSGPRRKMASPEAGIHVPNEETKRVLEETDAGIGLESHDSLEGFWKAMGMKPSARD